MTIVRYTPFRTPLHAFDQIQGELDRIFHQRAAAHRAAAPAADWSPAVDIREEEGRFTLSADLPGVDPAAVEVTLEKGVLTIEGRRELAERSEEQGYRRTERAAGAFLRRFNLPDSADPEGIEAHYRNGVLEVSIAKRVEEQAKRIEVRVTH